MRRVHGGRAVAVAVTLALGLGLVACAPGTSVVALTVTVAAGTQLHDVHHFSVSLRDPAHGKKVAPFSVPLASGTSLPPAQHLNLAFDASVSGTVLLHLDAVRADGATLASIDTTIAVKPSTSTSATVTLSGEPLTGDLGPSPDLPPGDMPPVPDGGGLTLTEAMVMLDAQPGAAATHSFVAIAGGVDVSALASFTVADKTLGTMQGATFTSAVTRGGTGTISANYMGLTAMATVMVRFHANVSTGCAGCATFPADGAAACAAAAQPTIVYPPDGALFPPNLGALEVQLTPGTGDTQLELDFANGVTDVRVAAQCNATTDQTGAATGGCHVDLDSATWDFIANSNRDGDPVTLTVRATTDGNCASPSTNTPRLMFAADDLTATIYYTEIPLVAGGNPTHGVIARKDFSNRAALENVALSGSTCYGCHFVSRDGVRLSVSTLSVGGNDDIMVNMNAQLVDVASKGPLGPVQPTGFQSFAPDHSHYVATNGVASGTTNELFLIDGNAGTSTSFGIGAAGTRPAQPDWSPDGSQLAFVIPTQAGYSISPTITYGDDSHVFGGSLWTASVSGSGVSGATALITSAGENNYYPSWSPDSAWIAFNRVALTGTIGTISTCDAVNHVCPNDSFFNPEARVMMIPANGGTTKSLGAANGNVLPNTYPRWAPQVTSYKGQKVAWLSFASLRDYGLRVRNHLGGQVICYPPDSAQDPGAVHAQAWPNNCEEPQIWMAGIILNAAAAKDPSYPAIWVPYQDPTKHDIMAEWATTYVP